MQSSDLGNFKEKFSNRVIKADAYFIQHTGFIPSQTLLKMNDYNLNGTPATMGFSNLTVLFVLTAEEVAFFSRFTKSLHLLTVVFNRVTRKDPIRIPLRVILDRIDMVSGRENLSLMSFTVKNESADLINLLGNYMALIDYKKESWEKLKEEFVPLNPAIASALDFNDYFELVGDNRSKRIKVSGFTADKVFLKTVPDGDSESYKQLKWYFRDGLAITDGKLDLSEPSKPLFLMEFHPRIVDAIESFQFKLKLAARKKI